MHTYLPTVPGGGGGGGDVHIISELTLSSSPVCSQLTSVRKCFEIWPKSGSLAPRQDVKLAAIFSPRCACVYDTGAICNYGNDKHVTKSMTVEGIGRYPYVLLILAPPTMPTMPKGKGVAKELDLEVVGKEGVAQSELMVNFWSCSGEDFM